MTHADLINARHARALGPVALEQREIYVVLQRAILATSTCLQYQVTNKLHRVPSRVTPCIVLRIGLILVIYAQNQSMSASTRENGPTQLSVNGSSSHQQSIEINRRISPAGAQGSILKDAATGEEMFVKGVGTHMWQSSGDETSNWTNILRSWHPLNFPRFAMARFTGGLTVLESCPNSWDRCAARLVWWCWLKSSTIME